MLYDELPIGDDAPRVVNAIVEVPKGSSNKYKYLADGDLFRFDRTLFSPLFYPCDYGWICGTQALATRKPLNILVMASNPTFAGCLVAARPVGALLMHDAKGEDNKILSVAVADPRFEDVRSLNDLSEHTLLEIQHFFEIYQSLERKEVTISGWEDVEATQARIRAAADAKAGRAQT
jgi:inorganic pyrophosphatase